MTYDLAILGGGPAGVAAGVYASRKRIKTIFITRDWQGQSTVSEGIENWIGTPKISGADFAKSLENHLRTYAGDMVSINEDESVTKLSKNTDGVFLIETNKGLYTAKAVLIATGSKRRKLEVSGAQKFEHKGITYCASCDGPMFSDMDVVVIGGGNSAFESAAQLLAYCKSVTILHRSAEFRADEKTVEKVLLNPKMHALRNVQVEEIKGDKFVSGLVYKDKDTGEKKEIAVSGIFVEIGSVPTTEFTKGLIELTENGHTKTDPRTQSTTTSGIWAAGDCTDGLYHQNNIAAGDAVKALEDIYIHLHTK